MELWSGLIPWWAWWADFTDLVDWNAWAAIATALAVIVALCTTATQERRIQRRIMASHAALHAGAVEAVQRGRVALGKAADVFHAAGYIESGALLAVRGKLSRAGRLLTLYAGREVEPDTLMLMLLMEDLLLKADAILGHALADVREAPTENAKYNGQIDKVVASADGLIRKLR